MSWLDSKFGTSLLHASWCCGETPFQSSGVLYIVNKANPFLKKKSYSQLAFTCSKSTMETSEQFVKHIQSWRRSGIFLVNISHFFLVFLKSYPTRFNLFLETSEILKFWSIANFDLDSSSTTTFIMRTFYNKKGKI